MLLCLSCFGFMIALPVTHSQLGIPFTSAADVFGSFRNSSEWKQDWISVPFCFYSVLFVNSTWVSPAYIAEETHDARRQSPRAIIESFLWTTLLGLIVCLVFAFCLNDLDAAIVDPYPLFTVIVTHWGRLGSSVFLIIGSILSMVGGSGILLTMATQVAAFARDGGLPYSSVLCRVHQRTNIPLNATVLLVILTYLFLLLALNQNAADIVYSMASLASLVVWMTPVCLRLSAGERWVPGPFYTGRYSRYIHFTAVLTSGYFFVTRCIPPTMDTPPINIIVVIVVLCLSVVAYFVASKDFAGLDMEALTAWRQANQYCLDGADFVDVVRQATIDSTKSKDKR